MTDVYVQLLAEIAEGARLHYDEHAEDRDLALLRGDQLYARGLSRLAELGDLDAISELADVISLVAQARASGDLELARAVWEAGEIAVRRGSDPAHDRAKALARAGRPEAAAELRNAAGARALLRP